jgi:hypothetical protein
MKVGRGQIVFDDIVDSLEDRGLMDIYRTNAGGLAPSFFFEPLGIHGIVHAKRVLLLNLILVNYYNLTGNDRDILVQASLYHDIGRTGNQAYCEHGRQSFNKMSRLSLIKVLGEDADILKYIVENHCIDDTIAIKEAESYEFADKARAIRLLKFFKDCDSLDRVRLGNLDIKYLRNEYSTRLVQVAEQLLREVK